MDARVIASFRGIGGPGRPFLERAFALVARLTDDSSPDGPCGMHIGWDVLKLTFSFEAAKLPALMTALTTEGPDTQGDEPRWAVGLAQGDVRAVEHPASPLTNSGLLWWGPPIVAASALAGVARPGDILCAQTIPAVRSGELVTFGFRIAREGTLRVRGARIDRRQPWKKQATENLARLVAEPHLVSAHLPKATLEPGAVVVLRADPGTGGTRFLKEVARPFPRALFLSKSGAGIEPLGALRRAFAHIADAATSRLAVHAEPLDALLAGKGVSLDTAARLITAFLSPTSSDGGAAIVLDDTSWIDWGTLEACVRAVQKAPTIGIIARLDATGGLPSVLSSLPRGAEYEIGALSRAGAVDLAAHVTGDALDRAGRRRWSRLGGQNPLAIVEAIRQGVAEGALVFGADGAEPRSAAAGRGPSQTAARWIRQRANAERSPVRVTLSLLAVCGGEAEITFLSRVLDAAGLHVDIASAVAVMLETGWLVSPQEGWVAFPTATHRSALFSTLEEEPKRKLHLAIARTIERTDGVFGRVEGAWHATQAGEAAQASNVLLEGAQATGEAGLEASTTQLIAFARRADPSCEERALEVLTTAVARVPSPTPPPPPPQISGTTIPSPPAEPPATDDTLPPATAAVLPSSNPIKELDGASDVGRVFGARAGDALAGGGDVGDTLRALRRTRSQLDPNDHRRRCQTSLALGVALSSAGRPQEALLEGLDALARARQTGDERGAKACLAFLAKLYTSIARDDEADLLRAASV